MREQQNEMGERATIYVGMLADLKACKASGKCRGIGSRTTLLPNTASKIRENRLSHLTSFSADDSMTCDRVIKNSREILTFHRSENLMISSDITSAAIVQRYIKLRKTRCSQGDTNPPCNICHICKL